MVTQSEIYLEFKAHLTSMATTAFCIPSALCLVGLTYFFQQDTSRLCKGYLTKKESDAVLYQMTWTPQSPDLNPIEMVLDELNH